MRQSHAQPSISNMDQELRNASRPVDLGQEFAELCELQVGANLNVRGVDVFLQFSHLLVSPGNQSF